MAVMPPSPQSESEIQSAICEWLHSNGHFFWRENNVRAAGRAFGSFRAHQDKYTPKGLPDVFVLVEGILYGLEIKRPVNTGAREPNGRAVRAGMLRPEQQAWGIRFEGNGGHYFCVRSVEDVGKIFNVPKGRMD